MQIAMMQENLACTDTEQELDWWIIFSTHIVCSQHAMQHAMRYEYGRYKALTRALRSPRSYRTSTIRYRIATCTRYGGTEYRYVSKYVGTLP